MLFNSWEFLIFFFLVAGAYFAIPFAQRWIFLLVASAVFYAYWKIAYLPLVGVAIATSYFGALLLHRIRSPAARRYVLWGALGILFGLLFCFKYANFTFRNVEMALQAAGLQAKIHPLDWVLPVGISFYTFEAVSYLVDVYRRELIPQRHLGKYALFILFFPKLVAGPIERASNLIPQFDVHFRFHYRRAIDGFGLVLWGLFKKTVIADRLAVIVDSVYAAPDSHSGLILLAASYAFAFQIYCDFSGYTDIAIGVARIFGFRLSRNFAFPYFSHSVQDFWRRWHITLTSWIRAYVYFPMGGSRLGFARHIINVLIVFLLSGIWHGANWTFVLWGVMHGAYIAVELMFQRFAQSPLERIARLELFPGVRWAGKLVGIVVVFHLVLISWIMFRGQNVAEVGLIYSRISSDLMKGFPDLAGIIPVLSSLAGGESVFVSMIAVLILLAVEAFLIGYGSRLRWSRLNPAVYLAVFGIILVGIALFGRFPENNSFIYFQF